MNISDGVVDVIARTADATTTAAGAVGGAAVEGVVGGIRGAAVGVKHGLGSGSHSTPAAVLTLAAIGATGLVDWPVLLGIGGAALVVHRLAHQSGRQPAAAVGDRAGQTPSRTEQADTQPPTATKTTPASKSTARARRSPSQG
ncbi:hypothetical protein ACIBG0_22960 [Nocardia sp. NPDC050630]|uniref:hypothetical protein n=1 Tax=Nocardia sp. NPDC050630 TaxID=3364321 RepID=UPI003796FBD3